MASSSHPCCSTPKEGQSPCLKSSTFAGSAKSFVGRACPSTALGSPPAVSYSRLKPPAFYTSVSSHKPADIAVRVHRVQGDLILMNPPPPTPPQGSGLDSHRF